MNKIHKANHDWFIIIPISTTFCRTPCYHLGFSLKPCIKLFEQHGMCPYSTVRYVLLALTRQGFFYAHYVINLKILNLTRVIQINCLINSELIGKNITINHNNFHNESLASSSCKLHKNMSMIYICMLFTYFLGWIFTQTFKSTPFKLELLI